MIYKSLRWLLSNVLTYSPVYFILGTILGALGKGLTIISMVASLRGMLYIFRLEQEQVDVSLLGVMEGSISRTTIIILIGISLLFLYCVNSLCNYYSARFIEKCNLKLFQNENAFNKINNLLDHRGQENKASFKKLIKFYRDTLPIAVIDLSKIIYILAILLMIFIVIGYINSMVALAILFMSFAVFLIMAKNSAKDLGYLNKIKELEQNVKKVQLGNEGDKGFNRKEITGFFSDVKVIDVYNNKASLRLLNPTNEAIYLLTYGVLTLAIILSFLVFDMSIIRLDPIYLLILIFSIRYGLSYSRLFGHSLARLLRIRGELRLLGIF